ncbi:MAG: hypothetical protein CVU50_05325 [Candidatus Cloacimonetes bacterium HGW-Cloacimonetes-3]|jgi:hypothetical protein|nr:MAG: hypothetical protein CVU50_05325 [Candidatus Cloacimonetes bacterium HGW-Cloacimonetes-3]
MKKTLLLAVFLILLLGITNSLIAQATVTVGNGTAVNTTTGIPTPYGTYYKNFHQQYLVRASELENSGGGAGNINSIAFNVQSVNTCVAMPGFTIKLKATTQTELTTTFEVGDYTTVFTSTEYLPIADWNTHTFTTPFNWNGTSNLIVDIVTTLIPVAYTQNASVYYTPTTFQSALRFQSDTADAASSLTGALSPNRANIRFNMAAFVVTNPPNAAVLLSPADSATLVSPYTTLNWIAGGGLPTGYRLSFGTNNPPTNISNNVDLGLVTTYDPPGELNVSTTYYWKITPYNSIGNAPNCPVWSFTTHGNATITALPYSQNWDAVTPPALPFDWTAIYQSTATTGYVKTVTTTPHSAPNCVGMANSIDAATTAILVGPPLAQTINANTVRVKFWAKGSASYHVLVGVMSNPTDPATFVMVQDINAIANWNEYVVDLTPYTGTGRHIAFKHASTSTYQTISLDGISFEPIAPNDLGATTITGNTTPSVNSPTTFTVGIQNWGTVAQSNYTVKLMSGTTQLASVAGTAIAAGATGSVQITWTPTVEGPISVFGEVVLTGDVNTANDATAPLNLSVMPAGMAVVTIGTGELAEGIPWEFFYKNSLFETLYYPTEIGMFGNITAVSFYNNFFTNLTAMPVKLWLGSTQLTDLSAGWILPDQLTLVYDGTLDFPSGENTITVPLQVPFAYSGGNLVLYANRPMDTVYYSSSDNFQSQTVGTTRARKLVSDSTVYDPAAPSAAGTLSGTFPKTTLHMTPLSPNPIFVVNPASHNYGTVLMNSTTDKTFSIMNAGGGTLNVSAISISGSPYYTLQNMPTLPANLATGQTAAFTVRYNPTVAGVHNATVTITDNRMVHTVQITGTSFDATIYTLPYAQAFDEVTVPALPIGWSSIYQASVTTGYVKTVTTSPQSTPNCVAMYNPTDTATIAMLVSPQLNSTLPIGATRVKLWGKGTNYSVIVGVMTSPTDPATFTPVQTLTFTSAWAEYAVPLTPYTGAGRFIAIKHANNAASQTIYLDTIQFETIAPNDLAAVSIVGNTTPSMSNPTTYTVSIFNNGTASQSAYSVKLYNSLNVELATAAGVTVAAGATVAVPLSWTPAAEGAVTIYGKVILAGDVNATNNQTANLNVMVMPAGIISVTIGDGSQTARMPIDMYYHNSVNQTIYYAAEIAIPGNILTMSLYNNFLTTTIGEKPIKIWMANTQLADLTAGWVPASQMTLVFDGNVSFPGGENTITFPLTAPFAYTGGNLLVMFNRPMDTVYYSSSDFFKCQTIGTNRARNIFNDTTVYNPENMTDGTVTGQFAKTTFVMTPMGGDPAFMVTPSSKNFGTVIMNSTHNQSFTVMNVGGGSLTINSVAISGSPMFSLQNVPTLPVSLNTGQTMVFTGRYSPTAPGTHAATITITDNLARSYEIRVNPNATRDSRSTDSRIARTVALSGTCIDTTINALPYAQAFDAVTVPALPPDWLKLVQATGTALVQTYTTTPHSTPNCAGMTNSTDANATAILIAPPLATAIATNTTRVKFWARSSGANYPLSIGIMSNATDALSYTETMNIALTTTWTEYVVTFAGYAGTGKHVAFKHGLGGTSRLIYIDDVMIEVTPTNDLAALTIAGNTTPSVGSPNIYNVNVFNWGTAAQSTYNVKLYNAAGTELATAPGLQIAPGASVQVPVSWTPLAEGSVSLYAKVHLTGDQNALNDQSNNLAVLVLPSGIFAVTVGAGDQTANIPINMYYQSSLYETLYYPAEMGNFMGSITGIQLYANFTQELLQKPVKVWIGTTTETNLSAAWIPSTALTLVFDGVLDFPLGENTITIPFIENYLYLNEENLVVMFFRPSEGVYWQSTNYFKCQTDAINTQRAKRVQSDSIIYDPATPPVVTATAQFPKMTFLGIPGGVGHLNGTVLGAGNQPLAGVAVQIANTTYATVTNATGQYEIRNILPNTYSVGFSKYGYLTSTQTFTLEEDETETVNITMTPMATVSLGGTILASDTAAGLANATIQFSGYQNYTATTAANGTFTVPAIYASQSYTYTVSCTGFRNLSGTMTVGTTNQTMPPMTLNELAYAPYGVVAALNQAQTEVALTWNTPNPNAVDVFESFEAATFPPTNWTQVINNTGPANENGVLPTWCSFGTTDYYGYTAVPTNGTKQAGIGFSSIYAHQDEWLISHPFYCPPEARITFNTLVFRGSTYNDHYAVKVSTNGGVDWTVIWDATNLAGGYTTAPMSVQVSMAAYGGQQIKFAFHAEDPPSNDGLWYDWYIDNIKITNDVTALSFSPEEMIAQSATGIRSDKSKSTAVEGGERTISAPISTDSRSLTGYKVWRLLAGQENNQTVWTSMTPNPVSPLTLNDTNWSSLSNGSYRWAVKAVYTNGVLSIPVMSNILVKQVVSGTIQGVVRKPNNQPLAGATISAGGNTAITNTNGLYSLSIPVGTYSVSCSAVGYQTNTMSNITVIANQSVTVNFNMIVSSNEDDLTPVTATALNGNYPNPFNPETAISYAIKDAGDVSLEIYNLKGQRVRSLVHGRQNSGNYRIVFDGKDDNGQALSSGVYLYRLSTGSFTSTRKMMLME